jgi:hypothetical protein
MNLPNSITMTRIVMIPLFLWILSPHFPWRGSSATQELLAPNPTICGILRIRSVIWKRVAIWPRTRPVNLARISPKPLQRVPISLLPGDYIRNRVTVGE